MDVAAVLKHRGRLVEEFSQDLGWHAVRRVRLGVDGNEVAEAFLVVHDADGDAVDRGRFGQGRAADHLRHGVAEDLQAGLLAGEAQVLVLAAVADLDGEAAGQACEERVGRAHERRAAQRVVRANGAVRRAAAAAPDFTAALGSSATRCPSASSHG